MEAYLSRVDLLVADMRRSLDFYSLLGFSFTETDDEQDYVEKKTDTGFRFSWCKREIIDGLISEGLPAGHRVEPAFRCEGEGSVDRTYRRIVEAGYESLKPPFNAPWGQ